jgi:hypothetical protein
MLCCCLKSTDTAVECASSRSLNIEIPAHSTLNHEDFHVRNAAGVFLPEQAPCMQIGGLLSSAMSIFMV